MLLLVVLLMMTACATTRKQASRMAEQESSQLTTARAESAKLDNLVEQLMRQQENSTQANQTLLMLSEGVPESTAQLTTSMENLRNLPDGAEFSSQSGRVSVKAKRQGDDIILTAKADSVARQCLFYEKQVFRQRETIDSLNRQIANLQLHNQAMGQMATARSGTTEVVEQTHKPPATWHWWFIFGLLVGGVAVAWLTKTNPLKNIYSFIKRIA